MYRTFTLKEDDDELRFEQPIENSSGRMILTVSILIEWQGMLSKTVKEFVREKWSGERHHSKILEKDYDYIKEFFAKVQCMECKDVMDLLMAIVKFDGEEKFRWHLMIAKKGADKFGDEEITFDEKKALL